MIRLLIILLAATVATAQVPDGQALINAALGTDYQVYEVTPTSSMKPMFDETYWILVKPLPFIDVRPGDVILYRSKTTTFWIDGYDYHLICHAVIRRSSEGSVLIAQGLANANPDSELITADMYRGTIVATIKRPAPYANTPTFPLTNAHIPCIMGMLA